MVLLHISISIRDTYDYWSTARLNGRKGRKRATAVSVRQSERGRGEGLVEEVLSEACISAISELIVCASRRLGDVSRRSTHGSSAAAMSSCQSRFLRPPSARRLRVNWGILYSVGNWNQGAS